MSTLMFTRTALSGVTSTVTPFVESEAPNASCTRLNQLPFMPTTPGTSRIASATIFSMTPLEKVRESSESSSSSSPAARSMSPAPSSTSASSSSSASTGAPASASTTFWTSVESLLM